MFSAEISSRPLGQDKKQSISLVSKGLIKKYLLYALSYNRGGLTPNTSARFFNSCFSVFSIL